MKIAIVGFSESSRGDAPFDDKEWEIWICNHLYPFVPRWDRHFEIHTLAYLKTLAFWESDYAPWLEKSSLDEHRYVYVNGVAGFRPKGSVAYPIDDMVARFGSYFTSTVAYMIALAIRAIEAEIQASMTVSGPLPDSVLEHEIGLWGVDMTHDTEWAWQRACVERLVGIAMGTGIKVTIAESSALLKCPWLYGYDEEPGEFAAITEGLDREDASARKKHEKAIIDTATYDGYRQALGWMKRRLREMKRGATF